MNPEEGALEQAKHLADLPFRWKHVALMPDTHQGYGMPIGGVLATLDVVIPNAVGVDIGCGMCAVCTSLKNIDTETLKKILGDIRKEIPVGFNHHKEAQPEIYMPDRFRHMPIVNSEYKNALKQLGTLGGGNHFIEIQKGDDDNIWVMIHSGSRNLGKKVADHYNKVAKELVKENQPVIPEEWDLAYLPVNSPEGQDYLAEMRYCVSFAFANRQLMMTNVLNIIEKHTGMAWHDSVINIAHNYANEEYHFGRKVWVHRKGATFATRETTGIIPGSQGTASYIVRGKGNEQSFNSCSHGAGRRMGRKQAERTLNLQDEIKKLDDQGILHAIRGIHDLDEASGAYKPIDEVMEEQKDLVDIIVKLTPLAVVKG